QAGRDALYFSRPRRVVVTALPGLPDTAHVVTMHVHKFMDPHVQRVSQTLPPNQWGQRHNWLFFFPGEWLPYARAVGSERPLEKRQRELSVIDVGVCPGEGLVGKSALLAVIVLAEASEIGKRVGL